MDGGEDLILRTLNGLLSNDVKSLHILDFCPTLFKNFSVKALFFMDGDMARFGLGDLARTGDLDLARFDVDGCCGDLRGDGDFDLARLDVDGCGGKVPSLS